MVHGKMVLADEWLDTELSNFCFIRSLSKIQKSWEFKPNVSDSWNCMGNISLKIQPVTKTITYLLLWWYLVKLISVLKRVSRLGNKTLQISDVQHKIQNGCWRLSLIARFFFKCVIIAERSIIYLAITPATVNHSTNQLKSNVNEWIKC